MYKNEGAFCSQCGCVLLIICCTEEKLFRFLLTKEVERATVVSSQSAADSKHGVQQKRTHIPPDYYINRHIYSRIYSRGSKVFCVCVSVSGCPHDRTKTAETAIIKLDTRIVLPVQGQKVKGQGFIVTKCKNILKAIEWPA